MIKKPLIIPFLITLIFSTFSPITIHLANAATVGNGLCISTVSSATRVTVTETGDYCVVSFTTAGTTTWTVPTGVGSVRTLVVGAGGGAGSGGENWMYGRGGGGGAVVDTAATTVTAGATLNIIVGAGGSAGVGRNYYAGGPFVVATVGGTGGSSQFGTLSPVSGGYSSPPGTSAGGASGSGYAGSGATQVAQSNSSFSSGGGGGAGGAGGQESGGNYSFGYRDKPGKGGIGIFSDITGSSIGHGGGGSGYAASISGDVSGTATSGGNSGTSAVNSGGSYGGGGLLGSGGSGVVIVKYLQPIIITITTITNKLDVRGSTTASATVNKGTLSYSASGACSVNSSTGAVTFTSTGNCTITATAASSPNPTSSTTFEIVPNLTQRIISRTGLQPNSLSSFIPPPYITTARAENVYACLAIVGATGATVLTSTNLNISLFILSSATMSTVDSGKSYTITGTLPQVQAAISSLKINSTSGRIMAANSGSIYLRVRANLIADATTDTECLNIGNDGRIQLYQYTSDQIRRKSVPQRSGNTP